MGFRLYRQQLGDAGFWLVSNKPMPKEIHTVDDVFVNKKAKPGQIKKAKLVCDGDPPKVKCRWVFDVEK